MQRVDKPQKLRHRDEEDNEAEAPKRYESKAGLPRQEALKDHQQPCDKRYQDDIGESDHPLIRAQGRRPNEMRLSCAAVL